jgi:alpha-mannosidase
VADPNVVVETAKWAEDDDGLIVRLYEAAGGSTSASLDLGAPANGVDQVDLLERNPRPLAAAENGSVSLDFRAREIKTVLVRLPSRG